MSEDITIQEVFKTLMRDRILKKYRFNIKNNLNDFAFHLSTMEGKKLLKEKPLDQATVDELLDTIPKIVSTDIILTINGYIFLAHICITNDLPELAKRPLNYALELSVKVFTESRGRSTQLQTEERRELLDSMEPFIEGILNFQSESADIPVDNMTLYETFIESGLLLIECARKTVLEAPDAAAEDDAGKELKDHDRVAVDHNSTTYHQGVTLLSKGYVMSKEHNIKPDKLESFADYIATSIGSLLKPEDDPDKRKSNLETALAAAKNIGDEELVSKITADLS